MKGRKIIVRVLSLILIGVIILGLVIPYVSASEIEPTQSTERPILPDGFQYIDSTDGKSYMVIRSPGNDLPSFSLSMRDGFDMPQITVFFANLETEEIFSCELYHESGYYASIDLKDGYYVVFANEHAWQNSKGLSYALGGGSYQYIYVGDNFDPLKYDAGFSMTDGIVSLGMDVAPAHFTTVKYGESATFDLLSIKIPENAKVGPPSTQEQTKPTESETQPDDTSSEKEAPDSLLDILWGLIEDSAVLLILIAICFVVLSFIRAKKKVQAEIEAAKDLEDEKRVD